MNLAQVSIPNTLFNRHPGANILTNTPGTLVSKILPNVIVLASIIFFLLILFGGLLEQVNRVIPNRLLRQKLLSPGGW